MIDNIDFVVTWVDGSDKNWLSKKNKYYSSKISKMKNPLQARNSIVLSVCLLVAIWRCLRICNSTHLLCDAFG